MSESDTLTRRQAMTSEKKSKARTKRGRERTDKLTLHELDVAPPVTVSMPESNRPRRMRAMASAKESEATATRRGCPVYELTARDLDFMDNVIDNGWGKGAASFAASDLACYIHNEGDADDRAEALLAILPIARRVFERD